MVRYGSATTLLGRLPSGLTVTIALWKASDGTVVTLSSNSCTEIGSTGIFRWATSNIQTQPTVETDYAYRMTTGQYQYEGKFTLQASTGASAADVADAVWDEAIADHTTGTSFGAKNQKVVPSETVGDYKATGFSTHTAADIWTAINRALSTPNDYKADVSAVALEATLTSMKGGTFVEATDSLEAIRNRGDAAWLTATGFATENPPSQVLNDYKADVSLLAVEATSGAIKAKTDIIPADLPDVPTATELNTAHSAGSWAGATAADIDTQLSGSHGSGSWEGSPAADVADAVWDEQHADHQTEGSFGQLMKRIHISIDDVVALILSGLRR